MQAHIYKKIDHVLSLKFDLLLDVVLWLLLTQNCPISKCAMCVEDVNVVEVEHDNSLSILK